VVTSTSVLASDDPFAPLPRPLRAPSIVCDDVDLFLCDDFDLGESRTCTDIALDEKFASECIYVAADPINFRDPWGLAAQEQGVDADGDDGKGTCEKNFPEGAECPIVPDEPSAPAPEPEPERDGDGCVKGPGGQTCRNAAATKRWNKEMQDWARDQQHDAAVEQKWIRAEAKRSEGSVLDTLKDAWDGLMDMVSFGDWAVDVSIGWHTHHGGGGYMKPPEILDRARDATEAGVLAVAPLVPAGLARYKAITEEAAAVAKSNALFNKNRTQWKAYEDLLQKLSRGEAGKNQHALTGDRAGQWAADLVGSGGGRGRQRVIFEMTDDHIRVLDIVDYH
jgi:hypothetical protein